MEDKEKYSAENGYVSINEILGMNGRKQRHMVNKLKKEDYLEERESYEQVENDIKASRFGSNLAKNEFINEIRGGLGKDIKESPTGIIIRKKTLGQKIRGFFVRFFTKF